MTHTCASLGLLLVVGSGGLLACGGDGASLDSVADGAAPSGGGSGLDVGGPGGSPSGSSGGLDEDGQCLGLTVADGCASEVYQGEAVPLDLYLMFDQSGSMATVVDEASGVTRMDIVRQAVRAFLEDEDTVGVGIGIGYFGHQPLGETSCDVAHYREAAVEVGPVPAVNPDLFSSLDAREPTGETPTGSAIRGACDYVEQYRATQPGRRPAILLVTDGEPKAPLSEEVCAPTLDDAVAAAADCLSETGISTYVLGVGPSLNNLDQIADGGGTKEAYLADRDNADQVLQALSAVRASAQLPCDLKLAAEASDASSVDLEASTVAYLDQACSYVDVPRVESESGCEDGASGWYFDDPATPTMIHLCEETCGSVKATGDQLFYSIGCPLDVVK